MPSKKYQTAIESINAFMVKMEDLVKEIIVQNNIPYYRIESRMDSQVDKSGDTTYVPVVRVVTYFEDAVSRISEILCNEFEVVNERSLDKKKAKADNFSYKHVQFQAALKTARQDLIEYRRTADKKFEIQVCSMLQDAWTGIEKELGYENATFPEEMKRDFYRLGALLEMADLEFLKIRSMLSSKYGLLTDGSEEKTEEKRIAEPKAEEKPEAKPIPKVQPAAATPVAAIPAPEAAKPQPADTGKVAKPAPVQQQQQPQQPGFGNQQYPNAPYPNMPQQGNQQYYQPVPGMPYMPGMPYNGQMMPNGYMPPFNEGVNGMPMPFNYMPVQGDPNAGYVQQQQQMYQQFLQQQHAQMYPPAAPQTNAPTPAAPQEQPATQHPITEEIISQSAATPTHMDVLDMNVNHPSKLDLNINNIEEKNVPDFNKAVNDALPDFLPQAPLPSTDVQPLTTPATGNDAVALNIDKVDTFNMNVNGMIERHTETVIDRTKADEAAEDDIPFWERKEKPVKVNLLDENLPMNDAMLREYVLQSKLVKEVDSEVARRSGATLNAEIDVEGDVERLKFLKVFTLKQLHERITDNKNDIVAFAEKWIGSDNGGSFDSGICLFYLEYLLVGKKNDPAFAVEYVLKFISDNDYSARFIIPTYNSISKANQTPIGAHLTLK